MPLFFPYLTKKSSRYANIIRTFQRTCPDACVLCLGIGFKATPRYGIDQYFKIFERGKLTEMFF